FFRYRLFLRHRELYSARRANRRMSSAGQEKDGGPYLLAQMKIARDRKSGLARHGQPRQSMQATAECEVPVFREATTKRSREDRVRKPRPARHRAASNSRFPRGRRGVPAERVSLLRVLFYQDVRELFQAW